MLSFRDAEMRLYWGMLEQSAGHLISAQTWNVPFARTKRALTRKTVIAAVRQSRLPNIFWKSPV